MKSKLSIWRREKKKKRRKRLGLDSSEARKELRGCSTKETRRNDTDSNLENLLSWTDVMLCGPVGFVAEEGLGYV